MKAFFRSLLRHPISIIFYAIYTWVCLGANSANLKFAKWLEANANQTAITANEVAFWLTIAVVVITLLFALVLAINAALRKGDKFYLWLLSIVILQGAVTLYFVLN